MSGERKGSNVARVVIYTLLFFPLAFIFLVFASRDQWMILLPFRLVFGWLIHATKALPHLFGKWDEAILPLGCLLMAAVIAHRFVRRWVDEKFPERTWRIRHTAGALSLLLLGSAAAIAASGVVHQMFWLASGNLTQRNRRADVTMAVHNGKQLMLALFEFETEKDRYPYSFEELEMEFEDESYSGMIRQLWWLNTNNGKVPEPWILLHPGSSTTALSDEPVIVSPVIAGEGMVVVGYGDASVKSIRQENLGVVLGHAKAQKEQEAR
jgi:hypothetical protein